MHIERHAQLGRDCLRRRLSCFATDTGQEGEPHASRQTKGRFPLTLIITKDPDILQARTGLRGWLIAQFGVQTESGFNLSIRLDR